MELTTDDRAALQGAIRVIAEILQQAPPEVPDTIDEWPENDEHLRGEFWLDWTGQYVWICEPTANNPRRWVKRWRYGGAYIGQESRPTRGPFTRTTDPSLPRTWDTLDDVPEDVERVTGDYGGHLRELTRSGLSESGWFQRAKGGSFRGWMELSADRTKHVTNILEDA